MLKAGRHFFISLQCVQYGQENSHDCNHITPRYQESG